jgi:chromosome segregation ATPase
MAKASAEDAQARANLRGLKKSLKRLQKELRKTVKKYLRADMDLTKIRAALDKAFDGAEETRDAARDSKTFDTGALSDESVKAIGSLRDLDAAMADLAKRLDFAKRMLKRSAVDDRAVLTKRVRDWKVEIRQPPKPLGSLLKMVKKGTEADHPAGALLPMLPMIVLFWIMFETIDAGLRKV